MLTRFHGEQLKTNESTIVTCEQSRHFRVHSIWMANSNAASTTYTIRHVPFGQTSSASFDLASSVALAGNTMIVFDQPIYLISGDKLTAFASTAARISMTVYGELVE